LATKIIWSNFSHFRSLFLIKSSSIASLAFRNGPEICQFDEFFKFNYLIQIVSFRCLKTEKWSGFGSQDLPRMPWKQSALYSLDYFFQEDYFSCIGDSMKKSAFNVNNNAGQYFSHGHSRCLNNGNYDPIQCIDYPGMDAICVCVNPWTIGDHLNPNGTTAYQAAITDLTCFDREIHDVDYFRLYSFSDH
jgi:hypothetical protein